LFGRDLEEDMKLENQVCSLELAKKLKELGVKQESLWWWMICPDKTYQISNAKSLGHKYWLEQHGEKWKDFPEEKISYSAFTVAELGEMLPKEYISANTSQGWAILLLEKVRKFQELVVLQIADTEANARAKMLIYLLENKLMEVNNG